MSKGYADMQEKYLRKTLVSEKAVLPNEAGSAFIWSLEDSGADRDIEVGYLDDSEGDGTVLVSCGAGANVDGAYPYYRGTAEVQIDEAVDRLRLHCDLTVSSIEPTVLLAQLYDATSGVLVDKQKHPLPGSSDGGDVAVAFDTHFDGVTPGHYRILLQIGFTTEAEVEVLLHKIELESEIVSKDFVTLRVHFEAFGDAAKASSRLRVYKLAKVLSAVGHVVTIGKTDKPVDIYVAQKVRPFASVKTFRSRNEHLTVVYDFDDNYVLSEQGVLHDLIAFTNHADLVTCGSEFLASAMRSYHNDVWVLDNPLDVASLEMARAPTGTLGRVGWFGGRLKGCWKSSRPASPAR